MKKRLVISFLGVTTVVLILIAVPMGYLLQRVATDETKAQLHRFNEYLALSKAATVQVVSGEIEFAAAEQTWILPAGTIVAVPAERHSLVARQHSVVLLTVAL